MGIRRKLRAAGVIKRGRRGGRRGGAAPLQLNQLIGSAALAASIFGAKKLLNRRKKKKRARKRQRGRGLRPGGAGLRRAGEGRHGGFLVPGFTRSFGTGGGVVGLSGIGLRRAGGRGLQLSARNKLLLQGVL